MRFTPRQPDSDERLEMQLSDEDNAKVHRGRAWEADVTDQLTGKAYTVAGADCGIPGCMCDAVIVSELEPVRH